MKRWKLISGLLLVFVLGGLAGSFGTGVYFRERFEHLRKDPKARQDFIMRKLSKKLSLTPEQTIKIRKIVEQMGERRREYYRKNRPEIKKIMNEGFLQIRRELNSDQQEKLDALRKKFEKRRESKEDNRLQP